jgi:hypothetical protein
MLTGGTVAIPHASGFSGTVTNTGAFLSISGPGLPAASYTQSGGYLTFEGNLGAMDISGGRFTTYDSSIANTGKLTLGSNATYRVAIYNTQPPIANKIVVTGPVNLGGATLDETVSVPGLLIDNQGTGPVVGTFAGLPEGATVPGQNAMITYHGGDGNDVVIGEVAPEVSFTATPANIPPNGSSTLTWATTNATSVVIAPGLGAQPLSGSVMVQPSTTTTYTLTASGPGGTAVRPVTVVVDSAGPSITFTASPDTIAAGQSSTLTWTVPDAASVIIDPGIGAQRSTGSIVVSPQSTTTYRLTATGSSGSSESSVTVTVVPLPEITFTTAPPSIAPGQQSMLSWNVKDATTVFIDHGIGSVDATGSRVVAPLATTMYTITATGLAGTSTASTAVTVMPPRNRAVRH